MSLALSTTEHGNGTMTPPLTPLNANNGNRSHAEHPNDNVQGSPSAEAANNL